MKVVLLLALPRNLATHGKRGVVVKVVRGTLSVSRAPTANPETRYGFARPGAWRSITMLRSRATYDRVR